jgi:hypothetical protein
VRADLIQCCALYFSCGALYFSLRPNHIGPGANLISNLLANLVANSIPKKLSRVLHLFTEQLALSTRDFGRFCGRDQIACRELLPSRHDLRYRQGPLRMRCNLAQCGIGELDNAMEPDKAPMAVLAVQPKRQNSDCDPISRLVGVHETILASTILGFKRSLVLYDPRFMELDEEHQERSTGEMCLVASQARRLLVRQKLL